MVDGYTVETTALRCFRDTTLTTLGDGLPGLEQALAAANLPPEAYPAVVADVGTTRAAGPDSAQQRVRTLRDNADSHLRDLGKAARTYDGAEVFGVDTVVAAFGALQQPNALGVPSTDPRTVKAFVARCTTDLPAGATSTDVQQGPLTPAGVLNLFDGLTKLLSVVGLGAVLEPARDDDAAVVRAPQTFRQAAAQLDKVGTQVDQLHAPIPASRNLLDSYWAGPASAEHRATAINNYRPHFEAISAHIRTQAEKDRQNATTQERVLFFLFSVFVWAMVIVGLLMIFMWTFVSVASAAYRIIMVCFTIISSVLLIKAWAGSSFR